MATNTYVALDKVTVGPATPSITFSSIPSTYTDLVIVCSAAPSTNGYGVYMYFNGSTASYYSATEMRGNGTAAASTRWTNAAGTSNWVGGQILGLSNTLGENAFIIQIMNYANTTTYKTYMSRSNTASIGTEASVGLWRGSTGTSTEAITSITIGAQSAANLVSGSTFSLYGIAAEGAAKASGGMVTSDASYYYHTFTSSGTFTPVSTLSCDVLVVAGGGGGGGGLGGGGGAGGVLGFASQSISTNQTVTIGAGGAGGTGTAPSATQGTSGNNSIFGSLTTVVGGGGAAASGSGKTSSTGGSGGGGSNTNNGSAGTSGQGNAGGNGTPPGNFPCGGGGGAGAVGQTPATNASNGGDGGIGLNTVTNWGSLAAVVAATGIGSGGYIGGGGGGGIFSTANGGTGGTGGGGNGTRIGTATGGTVNTGGGGGGSGNNTGTGGTGGSGIVIVRYAK
jgi:hypothetical protein